MRTGAQVAVFGEYTAWRGKLAHGDARAAYVMGPTLSGRIAPLASFWCVEDAIRWARAQARRRNR